MTATTTELMLTIRDAQLRHAREYLNDATIEHSKFSDDTVDYMTAALDLASLLVTICYDDDIKKFDALMDHTNDDEFFFHNYACDGVCEQIYELAKNRGFDLD